MNLDFYDRNGNAYAYTDDGTHLYTFSGKPIGYIQDDSIFRFDGSHVGYFQSGILRDQRGDALLFTANSNGGPMKPIRKLKPLKGLKRLRPLKGLRRLKPLKPMASMQWSTYDPANMF